MWRRALVVGTFTLLLVTVSLTGSARSAQADGFADVLVDDVVIGESEQRFTGMRAVEFPTDAETVSLEIDLEVLESHGIDVGDAAVELAPAAVRGATVETAAVRNGRIRLVFLPADTNDDAVIVVDEFRLVGLDTTEAEAAAGLRFEATFSAGEARVRSFDIVDPDRVSPGLDTTTLFTEASTHRVTLRDVHVVGENVTVELDARVLESHGIEVGNLEVDVDAEGATVVGTTVDQGAVTAVLSPDPGTVLLDVRLQLHGLDGDSADAEGRVIATDVSYSVTLDGAADEAVDVEPFDINTHPTTHGDHETTSNGALAVKGDGFGPTVLITAVVILLVLSRRRR